MAPRKAVTRPRSGAAFGSASLLPRYQVWQMPAAGRTTSEVLSRVPPVKRAFQAQHHRNTEHANAADLPAGHANERPCHASQSDERPEQRKRPKDEHVEDAA